MSTATTADRGAIGAATRTRSLLRRAAAGAAFATLANAALWAGGRAADASFLVSPPVGDTVQVTIALVVLKTLLALAAGAGLLALAARRSRQWARAVLVAGILFAVLSAGGPPVNAHDTATGMLLAAMHLVTGAAFLVTATTVARDAR